MDIASLTASLLGFLALLGDILMGFIAAIVNLMILFSTSLISIASYIKDVFPVFDIVYSMIPEPVLQIFVFTIAGTYLYKLVRSVWG